MATKNIFFRLVVPALTLTGLSAYAGVTCYPSNYTVNDSQVESFLKISSFNSLALKTKIRYAANDKRSNEKGTVIYYHGFADTFSNHGTLLKKLHENGFRIVTYDYPGHGGSAGDVFKFDLKSVAMLTKEVLPLVSGLELKSKPVVLMGWSTGGTLAVRIAQSWSGEILGKLPEMLVAFSPGLPVNQFKVGEVRGADLVNNTSLILNDSRPLTTNPLCGFIFQKSLVAESGGIPLVDGASKNPLPKQVAGLVILADDEDLFVKTPEARSWIIQKHEARNVTGSQCRGSHHGVEFDAPESIDQAIAFINAEGKKSLAVETKGSCSAF